MTTFCVEFSSGPNDKGVVSCRGHDMSKTDKDKNHRVHVKSVNTGPVERLVNGSEYAII